MTDTNQQILLRRKSSAVGMLIFDCPGKLNYLTSATLNELERTLDKIEADDDIRSLAIISGKADTFLSGADLREIVGLSDTAAAEALSRKGQAALRRLSTLGKPVVVGINGLCLGGGLELALWCHRRIATDHPDTILGLPEVQLGLLPGLGGTQLLPRLIGLKPSLELILAGEPVSARRAHELGIVDELVEQDQLLAVVEQEALQLGRQWQAAPIPSPADMGSHPDDPEAEKRKTLFAVTERSLRIRTRGHYPAPARAVEVIKHGVENGLDSGLEQESRAFGELAAGEVSRNLISLFFAREFTRQSAAAQASRLDRSAVRKVGVVGGGTMGTGIAAAAAARAGLSVVLREVDKERLDRAMAAVKSGLQRAALKGQDSAETVETMLGRIEPTVHDAPLEDADLIIEAVFEDLQVKKELFARLARIVRPDCVLATNTSSLSVSDLANSGTGAQRVLGLHFFHPVERMPLVEVISHESTSKEAVGRATGFVAQLGKIPVSVSDGPGFLVNRLLCCYLLDAARLLQEGTPMNWLEEAALDFGMPMGPMELSDEIGLDVAFEVANMLHKRCGERLRPPVLLEKVQNIGLLGKKTGFGFYRWNESGKRVEFEERLVSQAGLVLSERKATAEESATIIERLILPMVDEAARCLEEKTVRKPREIDLAMVTGIGFPAFRGGLLRYADNVGIPEIRERLEHIYGTTAPARQVSEQLRQMESAGRRFYASSQ